MVIANKNTLTVWYLRVGQQVVGGLRNGGGTASINYNRLTT